MRLRCYETIYLIKEAYAYDTGIEFTTFDNKKLYYPVAANQKASHSPKDEYYRKMKIKDKMNQLTISGYLEVFELEERD